MRLLSGQEKSTTKVIDFLLCFTRHRYREGWKERERGYILLTATSLSHVDIRERVPDWEVIVEDEPLWSSSEDRYVGILFHGSEEGKNEPNKRAGPSTNDVDARESSGVSDR